MWIGRRDAVGPEKPCRFAPRQQGAKAYADAVPPGWGLGDQ